jgi:hypothetical protein
MGTALALIGTAVAVVVTALFRRGEQPEPDTRASRAMEQVKQTSSNARDQIDSASGQYLKDVRENARRR